MSIIDTEEGYIGYGVTINSISIGQKLVFIKIDHNGEEILWKQFGNDYQSYFPGNAGGGLIKTSDNNLALSFSYSENGSIYSSLMKLNNDLDTIWKKDYAPVYKTTIYNCIQTSDNGYILTGWVYLSEDDYSDPILLKTDSLGNYIWHKLYGGVLADRGQDVMITPDGGYLIGGYIWDPSVYHSLDALVIKTDSLGNEEWTKTYGNPNVDDDMALVALADNGNYLMATVYGEWVVSPATRTGRIYLVKLNNEGTTIWQKKIAPKMYHCNIRNFRETINGDIVAAGFYYPDTTTDFILNGWFYKFNQEGDSIWFREYYNYFDQYAENMLYDVYPCQEKGYVGIGYARPGTGGSTQKMWVIKVDSMGCDTAGCATGTFTKEIYLKSDNDIIAFPNPAETEITLAFQNTDHHANMLLECYNIYGQQVHSEKIWKGQQETKIDLHGWAKGLYFAVVKSEDKVTGSTRFIKR